MTKIEMETLGNLLGKLCDELESYDLSDEETQEQFSEFDFFAEVVGSVGVVCDYVLPYVKTEEDN